MNRVPALIACIAILAALPACAASLKIDGPPTGGPQCPAVPTHTPDRLSGPLLLAAQSVPTAALVPCLLLLPAGWTFLDMSASKGKTSFILDFAHDNDRAAIVTLTRTCDVSRAGEIPTDWPGARRYEHVENVASGYRSEQYYVFGGGCVRYQFTLRGETGADQVHAISRTLSFVDRDVLRRFVHDRSDGRFELDPNGS
jgi:hypothetical protein